MYTHSNNYQVKGKCRSFGTKLQHKYKVKVVSNDKLTLDYNMKDPEP